LKGVNVDFIVDLIIKVLVLLVLGTYLIFHGVILATTKKIALGAAAIAVGGLLTTWGWNNLNTCQQRHALVTSVAQEWRLNQYKLKREDGPFAGKLYDNTGKAWRYPLFRESALNGVVTSGLFSFGNQKDKQLLRAIGFYLQSIEGLNRASTRANWSLEQDANSAEKYHHMLVDSHWYNRFEIKHEEMKELLENNYKWTMAEQKE